MNRTRGGSLKLNRDGGRFNEPRTVNCALFLLTIIALQRTN